MKFKFHYEINVLFKRTLLRRVCREVLPTGFNNFGRCHNPGGKVIQILLDTTYDPYSGTPKSASIVLQLCVKMIILKNRIDKTSAIKNVLKNNIFH